MWRHNDFQDGGRHYCRILPLYTKFRNRVIAKNDVFQIPMASVRHIELKNFNFGQIVLSLFDTVYQISIIRSFVQRYIGILIFILEAVRHL